MKFVLLAALVSALTACATQETVWDKPGSSQQSFDMDMGQCNAQAFSVTGGNLYQVAIVQNSCMRGKGWNLVPKR